MTPMYVLTVKRDGGTQDVRAFYEEADLELALQECELFLVANRDSKRAIVRLEWYNPNGKTPESKVGA